MPTYSFGQLFSLLVVILMFYVSMVQVTWADRVRRFQCVPPPLRLSVDRPGPVCGARQDPDRRGDGQRHRSGPPFFVSRVSAAGAPRDLHSFLRADPRAVGAQIFLGRLV